MLSVSTALTLALACAPRVAPDVLLSVAYAESHWRVLEIHDNVTGDAFEPRSKQEAAQIASRLISEGHNPDLGLLQINAANLSRTGLTVATAFEPCASMRAGAQILLEDYSGGATSIDQQTAIRRAFSSYNTGSPTAGLRTYTPRVIAVAAHEVIPALRIAGVEPLALRHTAPRISEPDSATGPPTPAPDPFAAPADAQADLSYSLQQRVQQP